MGSHKQTSNNSRWPLLANILGVLSIVMLLFPGITFLMGGSDLASERFQVSIDTDSSRHLAMFAGFYKGTVDIMLIPIGLITWYSKNYKLLAWLFFSAVIFIPVFDLVGTFMNEGKGTGVLIHIPYIIILGLSGCAFYKIKI